MKNGIDKKSLPPPLHLKKNDALGHAVPGKVKDKEGSDVFLKTMPRSNGSGSPLTPHSYEDAEQRKSKVEIQKPKSQAVEKDYYRSTDIERYTGNVFGFDIDRDQPFVEIKFNNCIVGDLSWVKGCDEPVITLEPSDDLTLRRLPLHQFIKSMNDALEQLGSPSSSEQDAKEEENLSDQ